MKSSYLKPSRNAGFFMSTDQILAWCDSAMRGGNLKFILSATFFTTVTMVTIVMSPTVFAETSKPSLQEKASTYSTSGASTSTPAAPPAKNYNQVVTSAVGQVGNEVVTSREVQVSYALDQALLAPGTLKKNADRSNWIIVPGTEAFRAHLSQVLLELLIKLEAESFSVAQVSSDDIKADIANSKESFKDWAEWKKWDVTELELERLIFRRKMAKNFLKFKTESSGVVVSDAEVKAYYEKNRVKFGSAPFEQFKEGIRDVLSQQQLEEKLKDWFEVLKRKYRVRFLKSPEA